MSTDYGAYSGRPAYWLGLTVSYYDQQVANNRSRFAWTLFIYHATSASNNSYANTARPWAVSGVTSGSHNFPMGPSGDYVGKTVVISSGITGWINHNPTTGALTYSTYADHNMSPDVQGYAVTPSVYAAAPTIAQVPGAPTLNAVTGIGATSATGEFSAPSVVGGSAIIDYTEQFDDDPLFASPVSATGAGMTLAGTGLAPSTTYYSRVRARNTQGSGAWSNTRTFVTAAAGAPHLGVLPKGSTGFYLTLTPPFSVGSVDSYTVRRTISGPDAGPVVDTVVSATGTNIFDALVLEPGQSVSYQALATISSVPTGFSASVTFAYQELTVSAPSRALWDGSSVFTSPFADQAAFWNGVVGSSTSKLVGSMPLGWRTFAEGVAAGITAKGVVTQINTEVGIAGTTGTFDVLAIFGDVQSGAGVRVGTAIGTVISNPGLAGVFPNVNYFGSALVMTDNITMLACEIEWYGSDGTLISRTQGATVTTVAGVPVEVTADGQAPSTAVYAAICVVDVTGADWHAGSLRWVGAVQLSASARYPLFDGSKTADTLYAYSWMGIAHESPSLRETLAQAGGSGSLQDPLQTPLPAPPTPPVVEEDLVISDIVWRRYIAAVPKEEVREHIESVPTLAIRADALDERTVRVRFWRNPQDLDPDVWTDTNAEMTAEMIIGYIPAAATFTIDGVAQRAYVVRETGDDAGNVLPADHLLYGEDGGVMEWPVLDCGVGYILTMDVPITATAGNLEQVLDLTDRMV